MSAQGGAEPFRVEVVPTADHGEARWIAPEVPMARGWLRQLDRAEGALFYARRLDPEAYRRWLADRAVRFVALPRGAPIDAWVVLVTANHWLTDAFLGAMVAYAAHWMGHAYTTWAFSRPAQVVTL